jgi:hypothetical protein
VKFAVVIVALLSTALRCSGGIPDLTGRYESDCSASERYSVRFRVSVKQTGSQASVSFTAAFAGGHIAAPDGEGTGEVSSTGKLTFRFEDSFSNEGTATLKRRGKSYVLTIRPTKVVEKRPLLLYADPVYLKKKSSIPGDA